VARPPAEYRDIHKAADSIEPRLAAALVRGMERARAGVAVYDVAQALQWGGTVTGRADRVLALLTKATLADALSPVATISRDAYLKGGKLGAEALNRATGRG